MREQKDDDPDQLLVALGRLIPRAIDEFQNPEDCASDDDNEKEEEKDYREKTDEDAHGGDSVS